MLRPCTAPPAHARPPRAAQQLPRRLPRRPLRRLVPGLRLGLTLLLALGAAAAGARAAPAAERPVRLGIYHPLPHLCLADEPSQRDLRVLRLAYGVLRVPERRLDWPWFYRVQALQDGAGPGTELALDTEALWGRPVVQLLGGHPQFAAPGEGDRLALWRGWVAARLPGVQPAELFSLAQLRGPAAHAHPFFPSRLAGSRLLPFDLSPDGARPEDLCRSLPAGVQWLPGDETYAYELVSERGEAGAPFHLYAYRERRELWRDYFRGRLDALLLEGEDYDGELERYHASQLGPWGTMPGTQQIVLRLRDDVAAKLGREGRLALSLALPRRQLAQVDGPGRFGAALSYFDPVQAAGSVQPEEALLWDTLRARRIWLDAKHALPELRLVVLQHPVLERLAARMQAQWNRTLNLTLRVQPLPPDQFYRLIAAGEAELVLEVDDLDDGSLQSLWSDSLAALHVPLSSGRPAWEAALRKGLPYLPVLGNVHGVLLRREAPPELLQRVCPGCRPSDSPRRLTPEPQERENPQG
jgi:hypothetical protein